MSWSLSWGYGWRVRGQVGAEPRRARPFFRAEIEDELLVFGSWDFWRYSRASRSFVSIRAVVSFSSGVEERDSFWDSLRFGFRGPFEHLGQLQVKW